jgi:hypothetical protein
MTWAIHSQRGWEEYAGNPRLPLWLRVTSLAFGKHRSNGHAEFRIGEVALVLSRVNITSGEITVPDRQAVQRAINKAIEYEFLIAGSGARCLIVPGGMIRQGPGNANEPCAWHTGVRRTRARERPLSLPDPLGSVVTQ